MDFRARLMVSVGGYAGFTNFLDLRFVYMRRLLLQSDVGIDSHGEPCSNVSDKSSKSVLSECSFMRSSGRSVNIECSGGSPRSPTNVDHRFCTVVDALVAC